jgi:hypothetical protein
MKLPLGGAREARRHRPADGVEANEVTGGSAHWPVPARCLRMSLAALRRRGRRQAARRADACVRARGKRRGPCSPSAAISAAHARSNAQERLRGGRYFIYRPPQDGRRSTVHPEVRPGRPRWQHGRPAPPSRSPPAGFPGPELFATCSRLPGTRCRRRLHRIDAVDAGAAARAGRRTAALCVCWWTALNAGWGTGFAEGVAA